MAERRLSKPRAGEQHHLLPWYLNGTLSVSETVQFQKHLQGCNACTSEMRFLKGLQGQLGEHGEVFLRVRHCLLVSPGQEGRIQKVRSHPQALAQCRTLIRDLRLHAVNRAGPLVGRKVLITGSGPIGALVAVAARRAGAIEIAATDVAAFPLKMIEQVGADYAFNVARNADALKPFTKNKGIFDVLFEASGNQMALTGALDALRPGATIVQIGLGGDITLPMNTVVAKELILKGTFRFHKEFETAVDMMNNGLIDVAPVITQTLPYKQAAEAFDLASDRSKAMKIQLAFS